MRVSVYNIEIHEFTVKQKKIIKIQNKVFTSETGFAHS